MAGEVTDHLLDNHKSTDTTRRQSSYGASVDDESNEPPPQGMATDEMSVYTIAAILSTAFSYGCIMTTLFLITLPVECERVNLQHNNIPKSVALGIFVTIAGVTQLISPIVGRLSDSYVPPVPHELGQRLPYLVLGSVATVVGLLCQMFASAAGFWVRYSFAFFLHMIGCKQTESYCGMYDISGWDDAYYLNSFYFNILGDPLCFICVVFYSKHDVRHDDCPDTRPSTQIASRNRQWNLSTLVGDGLTFWFWSLSFCVGSKSLIYVCTVHVYRHFYFHPHGYPCTR